MAPIFARVVGGPGAGKTRRLLEIIDMVINRLYVDPMQIGFVSFTRAARSEAASRAAAKFGIPAITLEKEGYFRTLHSVCYKQLGIAPGELITGSKDDLAWMRNTLQDAAYSSSVRGDNDDAMTIGGESTPASRALAMWDATRNRLVPLGVVWGEAANCDDKAPPRTYCERIIKRYEEKKREDGRVDFCDLLMLFAGKKWSGEWPGAFEDEEPHGESPDLPVFFHDEMQDCSLLTSLVFARLTRNCKWVYLAGDRNQEIFSWAGADGGIFANWRVEKEDFLPQSHRCPSEVLDFGKSIIRDPRLQGFAPVHQGGLVDRFGIDEAMNQIKAGKDTLVLARTNDLARKASSILDQRGIPWKMTKGNGGFNAPARAAGVAAILALRRGEGIDPVAIHRMMELFPVRLDGVPLFEHGAKSHYADKDVQANAAIADPIGLANIEAAGGTQAFKELIGNESYLKVLEKEDPPAAKMAVAAKEHGIESVINPSVRVGTCHSAKGMEAEHVVLFDQIPYPTMRSIQTERGMDEERRVFYVSATRASERLTIASCEDKNKTFPALLPQ